jgi:hypothetical protein
MLSFMAKSSAKGWLDDLAHHYRLPRSKVIRLALLLARRHEPELRRLLEEQG